MSDNYDEMDPATHREFARLNKVIGKMSVGIERTRIVAWLSLILAVSAVCLCLFSRKRSYPRFERAEGGLVFDRDEGRYLKPNGERFVGFKVK